MIVAMANDPRVLVIKVSDRLHNMRTLHYIKSPEKRRRIARETMDIYAPLAERIAAGPVWAHGITKTQLNQEWNMGLDQAIEAEAQAQAICMQTRDFERAYRAFVAKDKPVFQGD